ncbi:type IX secretion system motor protein PorM/GldM [Psychroflexus sediminis]|uniref:Protein involved in gliding motility GldM n=1 Tax=Psychroflexus sediminis TaxID=470826 RepID=A0A1G7U7U5_9FLAO|nr:gliding motility protein GldM [Psychroflexus sediminis]SDG42810.1 protein involved in gliding motility GldM [Psychroflexus sediminis]
MASGKQTPRQKMINLMYLVFIAMLALNMSKEVLRSFGIINESLVEANEKFVQKNEVAVNGLIQKAKESPKQFNEAKGLATSVASLTDSYYQYLGSLKDELKSTVDDPQDYESMDKSAYLDQKMISSGNLTKAGEKFMNEMEVYHDGMLKLLGDNPKYLPITSVLGDKFSGEDIVDGENVTKKFIEYHFIGFPLISSITKLSTMQNDIRVYENEILSILLAGELTQMVSMTNYTTLLKTERGAYYQGDKFNGEIVLGRTDESTVPNEVNLTLDGRPLDDSDYSIVEGRVVLNVTAGQAGEHQIEGELIFKQNGEEIKVPVNQSFSVIPKPNQAIVSADKMNVVYRGIENPITVSMPGVPGNKVSASAPGLRRIKGSQYIMVPKTGNEVKINVVGEIDGKKFPSSTTFRIKSLPRPTPTVRGQVQEGSAIQMPKNALKVSPVGATFENFDFDITPVVKRFTMSIPGQPAVVVNGNRLDRKAQELLDLARAGDIIQIFDIKADVPGVNVKNMPAILVQITN